MPYPNEMSCRLHNPDIYQKDSFRRITRGNLSMVIAKRPGKDTTEAQAYRYPIDKWSEEDAKKHCEEQKGTFELASKEEKMMGITAEELIQLAEQNPELSDYQLVEKALGEGQDGDMRFCTLVGEDGMVSLVLGEKSWKLGKM